MSDASEHQEDAAHYVAGGMRCGKTLVMENAKLKAEAASHSTDLAIAEGKTTNAMQAAKEADAEVKKLKATIEPVRSWYDGDGRLTDVAEMLTAAIADLQQDRAAVLTLGPRVAKLETALRNISHVDKTPHYGYTGQKADKDRRGQLPKNAGERWKTPREIVADTLKASS